MLTLLSPLADQDCGLTNPRDFLLIAATATPSANPARRTRTFTHRPGRTFVTTTVIALLMLGTVPGFAQNPPTSPTEDATLRIHFRSDDVAQAAKPLVLRGKDAKQQLLVTAKLAGGAPRDFTRKVAYAVAPATVAKIDRTGTVIPLSDGTATITAKGPDDLTATLLVTVEQFDAVKPINFPNQIVPIFTKTGCNAGGCHGKSSGQNGFKLSLLGFEPAEDYEHLVKEARGRRLFPAAPENSLLLLKATATLPHGGGKRLETDSDDYRLLLRWISQGMPYGKPSDPTIDRIDVFPKECTMALGDEQQLVVRAHYTDGSVEDVTRSALYEPNDKEMAQTDETGHVKLFEQPGDVAVMVRYQAKVAVFRATVPLGAPVENLPSPKNFIDERVFAKLKTVGMPPSEVCDDSTFIRRVTLDITGRLPTPEEVKRFLAECGTGAAIVAAVPPHPDPLPEGEGTAGGRGENLPSASPTHNTADSFPLSPGERVRVRGKGSAADTAASRHQTAREALIDRLLDSADYADYFANKWSALLRNKRNEAKQARGAYAFHAWIRDSLFENKPFDQFVREILAASGEVRENPPVAWYRQVREPQAQLEDTAQLFLGMRLQCAQCHHHPFEKWSQNDYYSFSAFFSQVGRKPGAQPGEELIFARNTSPSATNKKTKQPVKPAGLASQPLSLSADDDARQALADWMTGGENPFFAKSLVNRYWKHFFNRGIVDPEDDMRETNPPTNPELLDALAKHFVGSGYDLKELLRTICRSQAYQLSAIPNEHNKVDKKNFSRYYPRRLTAEVLFDAVNQATKSESKFEGLPAGTRAVCLPDNSFNAGSYFLTVFGRPDSASACECERSQDASLAQSLHLLNAKDIQEKLVGDKGMAALLAGDEKRGDDEKLRELYLTVFSREPSAAEISIAKDHLGKTVKDKEGKELPIDKRQAYEDVIWALINTKEFLFNH
jgi:uncharacterized protein DUF1553/uncharacterized protein DUF1549